MFSIFTDQQRLTAAKRIIRHVAGVLELPLSVRLWDGAIVPLGKNADRERFLSVDEAGVFGAMLRHPSLETLYRLYASGHIDVHGADFMVFLEIVQESRKQKGGQEVNRRSAHGFPLAQHSPAAYRP